MFKYKNAIIMIACITIFIILMIIGRTPTIKEIKEKIQLTTVIQIEKTEMDSNKFTFYKKIENRKKVQEIISFISSLEEDEWEALSEESTTISDKNSGNYRLRFLNSKGKEIATMEIYPAKLMKLKYKIYTHKFGIRSGNALRKMIEQNEI